MPDRKEKVDLEWMLWSQALLLGCLDPNWKSPEPWVVDVNAYNIFRVNEELYTFGRRA